MNAPKAPQRLVPTLTEVIELPGVRAPRWGTAQPGSGAGVVRPASDWGQAGLSAPDTQQAGEASRGDAGEPQERPAVAEALEWPSEEELVRRVVGNLQLQLDAIFEGQMQDLMAPALARAADGLIRELRGELGVGLRSLVERAVAQELARLQRR